MIKVKDLRKSYGHTKAVDDISFEIGVGEVVGLLGPNGAGKTTTMKMITGFLKADSGSININGKKIDKNKYEIQRNIGYLPENSPLYEELTISEFLEYTANMRGIEKHNISDDIKRVLDLCGIKNRKNMLISELSKGYKQRTGLASALLGNPAILILDEPTSGLDPNQIVEIRKLLSNIAKETNATIIISTHIMQEAESMCSRIIIINKGKIAADGSLEAISDSQKSKDGIIIDFEASNTKADTEKGISKIKNLVSHEYIGKHGKNVEYRITVNVDREESSKILKDLLKAGVDIYSFKPKKESLENIFSQLTK